MADMAPHTTMEYLSRHKSPFANSLCHNYQKFGRLSAKQWKWADKLAREVQSREELNVAGLKAGSFDTLMAAAPLWVDHDDTALKIKQPKNGKQVLYVTLGSDYIGRLTSDDKHNLRSAEVVQTLREVAANPKDAAIAFGHKFGICGCCGRTLTDPESIAKGIGPICEANHGW